jgi:hypothetical protein
MSMILMNIRRLFLVLNCGSSNARHFSFCLIVFRLNVLHVRIGAHFGVPCMGASMAEHWEDSMVWTMCLSLLVSMIHLCLLL